MAVTLPRENEPEPLDWPELDRAAPDRVWVDYDPDLDTLCVQLLGRAWPAVWDWRGDGDTWVGVRLDQREETTRDLVGIMLEHIRQHARGTHPHWRGLTSSAADERRRALRALVVEVSAMPAG